MNVGAGLCRPGAFGPRDSGQAFFNQKLVEFAADSLEVQTPYEPALAEASVTDTPPSGEERRRTLRAYNYWSEKAGSRAMPALNELDVAGLEEFRPASFLIGFDGADYLAPVYRFVGAAIQAVVGPVEKGSAVQTTARGTVLGRVADHYLQAVANEAPIGFDAEFETVNASVVYYRGILLPLSEDGERVDLLLGVLSWKEIPAEAPDAETAPPQPEKSCETTSLADAPEAGRQAAGQAPAGPGEGLQALLAECQIAADQVKAYETRSHQALYTALARLYAFSLEADARPESYRALLRQAGIKTQTRAPLTPMVKLVFGRDTDKARITEYAAALSYLRRRAPDPGEAETFIAGFEGGIKGLVAAERAARRAERGEAIAEKQAAARRRLAETPGLALEDSGVVAPGDSEYVVLVARRRSERLVDPVVILPESPSRLEATLQRAARQAESAGGTDQITGPE